MAGPQLWELPADIRHIIYGYLFSHVSPIWIGTKYHGMNTSEESEPVFYTQLFRVNKKLYLDAISYAYGSNQFVLKDTFTAFCSLSPPALTAIKDLTVVHTTWTAETSLENKAWECLRTKCPNLKRLEVEWHSDLILRSICFLADFFASIPEGKPRPILTLDLYILARHFTFDPVDRDFSRSFAMLCGRHVPSETTPEFVDPRTRVVRLPQTADDIILSADVSPGTIQAIDAYLAQAEGVLLRKTQQAIPKTGRRSIGRDARIWYTWSQ